MLFVWGLTVFSLTTVQSLPTTTTSSSSSAVPSLVFTADSPGYAQLEVAVSGSLGLSLSFKTEASEGQLLYNLLHLEAF